MSRKSRKTRSKRGSRTHGGGGAKKRRHSGHKGGKGMAGSHKHKWRDVRLKNPKHFGKHGFKIPQSLQQDTDTINVGELDEYVDELLEKGIAKEKDDEIVLDISELGFDKVLGSGQVTHQLRIRADDFSSSAESKIEEAGGTAETTGEN